jgi:PelA/Pel-15E family pectate lyase
MVLRNSFFAGLYILALLSACLTPSRAADQARSWPPDQFLPLTDTRIAALPETERGAWRKYLEASRKIAATMPTRTEPDFSPLEPLKAPLGGAKITKGLKLNAEAEWYVSEEARVLADRVGQWQTAAGGWTKGIDYSQAPRSSTEKAKADIWTTGTFDNDATITELRFLVSVVAATPADPRADVWRSTFIKGLNYIFNAQYPNGGFPQIYPLVGGYHDAITYNDNAMVRVLALLSDVTAGLPEFMFVPADLRAESGRRLALGIGCVLKSQIVEPSGRRTAWCQQHDMLTLKPCAARNFEPIAVSAAESAGLVSLLMRQPDPAPALITAVDSAIAWFGKVALHDVTWDRTSTPSRLVPKPGADEIWARLYEIETDKPVFGDRDRTIHYAVGEISPERQHGYSWYNGWPVSALKEYKVWREKLPAVAAH